MIGAPNQQKVGLENCIHILPPKNYRRLSLFRVLVTKCYIAHTRKKAKSKLNLINLIKFKFKYLFLKEGGYKND